MKEISVVDPITQAWARTIKVLFQPFDIRKWFVLGFCAWLATLGEGGSSYNSTNNMGDGNVGDFGFDKYANQAEKWVEENLWLLVVLAVVAFVVVTAIGAVITWLKCRGQFMFIDGVVRNRGAVGEPWREYRRPANNLFVVEFVINLVFGLLIIVALLGFAWVLFGAFRTPGNFVFPWVALAVVLPVVFVLTVVGAIIKFVLDDLVLPTMYANQSTVAEAWPVVKAELIPGNIGTIILYVLMKFVLGIGVAIVAFVVTLITCCIAALPYIGTVILLPLLVFMKSYNLYFVHQFGGRFQVFQDERDSTFD